MSTRERVFIAGAGPVGLSAANVLADAGVSVVVFEAEDALPETLRASTFQPPTLDMLERLEASDRLIEMGRVAPRLQYRDRSGWVAEFDFGMIADMTRHPYRVQCEQFKLNRVLVDRLSRFAHASVRFGEAVEGIEQHASSVTVTTRTACGRRKESGSWLIGADGGRSRVRELTGISLVGFTWPERFLVASTPFEFAEVLQGLADVSYVADPEEWYFLLRTRDVWRVMFPVDPHSSNDALLTDDSIQRRLQRVYSKKGPYEIGHRTIYSVHQRVASTYTNGRVFLAGDAAHLNNPLGGMGMNGGIHDAFNLADKLALVIAGKVAASTLDRYEEERRPIAVDYVDRISIANKCNLETRDPLEQRRWRQEMTRTAADTALARAYLRKVSLLASLDVMPQGAHSTV